MHVGVAEYIHTLPSVPCSGESVISIALDSLEVLERMIMSRNHAYNEEGRGREGEKGREGGRESQKKWLTSEHL